ncbi:hypothetical protein A3A05_03470 [Candidatus Nomurabacteria bacterium RIFCSPLOWO2_01_FULL_41_12]|uniref:Uncharacterized protein n=1 Tax=Candidatus Nomurabacteria bacterium RIFCSPLOWO2_01_FULL_41_12 TaxID=1801774 RepID=A0A1F6WXM4_9BACT|nr:MAG: hypothetical protein A3A05_03470 [Candidatus Nomurabacteria bacterium RIFCSPLOWO2_01_FULL_41_12]
MDPETRKLLERTSELAEENNKILRSMRRSQRISSIIRFVYWAFIIGSAVGAYYFIQPYLTQVIDIYSSISDTQQKLNSEGSIGDLLKKFQN